MAVRILPFDDDWWPALRAFLDQHWQENHALCTRELFYWQYQGFGDRAGVGACRIAVHDDQIVGFLGAIPGMYKTHERVVNGIALALWVVRTDYRNTGLGMLLIREVQRQGDVVVCLGVNRKAIKYFTATGYAVLPRLNRYVLPLDPEGFAKLLANHVSVNDSNLSSDRPIEPCPIEPRKLATLWTDVANQWKLTLWRNEAFWRWRYENAVGFKYLCFGDLERTAVITRLDRVAGTNDPDIDGRAVLRIIELLQPDAHVLHGTLAWAKQQGAVAADFQCSSSRFERTLADIGFKSVDPDDPATHVPEVFDPLTSDAAPINLVARATPGTTDFDAVYFVKSDGDMDRPIRLP